MNCRWSVSSVSNSNFDVHFLCMYPPTTEQLTKLGYAIEYIPSIHLNRLTIVMKEREIFRCDIRNLLFNMDYCDDVVGKRLVAAVEEARKRIYNENNIPMYDSVKEGMRLLQRQCDAKNLQDLLPDDTKIIFEIPLSLTCRKFTYKLRKPEQKEEENNNDRSVDLQENASRDENDASETEQ